MKNTINYIKQRPILKHILFGIAAVLVILWIFSFILKIYTKHNSTLKTPDFIGVMTDDLEKFADEKDVKYVIIDSIYLTDYPKGTVYEQEPSANSPIKPGRTIYLTVTAKNIEKIKMPNLIDISLKQALDILQTNGLKPGRLQYVPDIAENAVLKQQFKGKQINAGTLIDRGSSIDLVIGRGGNGEEVEVPDLIGKRRNDAQNLLTGASLNIGSEKFTNKADSLRSYIYKQNPAPGEKLSAGSSVDVWYSTDKPEAKEQDNSEEE